MRDDYVLKGTTVRIEIEVEQAIAEKLSTMEKFTKLGRSELANTALKRFIAQHKDFFPPEEPKTPALKKA